MVDPGLDDCSPGHMEGLRQVVDQALATVADTRRDRRFRDGGGMRQAEVLKEPIMTSEDKAYRVLVVDDDAVIRETVGKILARFGYDVTRADDGAQALANIGKGPDDGQFDLLVSDLDMPFLDGYELACRVKASNRRTKVVIMTGSGLPQAAARPGCREIDGWLFKPFGLQAMRDVLKTLDLPHAFAAGPATRGLRRSA